MTGTGKEFNVDKFLDERPLGAVHFRVMALLVLTMLIDGYDLFIIGLVLPVMAQDWHVAPAAFTSVFVAQQAGLLSGVILTGPLSDRLGRKTVLLGCLVGFTLCTLAVTLVGSVAELTLLRYVSALFFSGVAPNCATMASEIAPKRFRASSVTIVWFGYAGGAFLGASVLAFVIGPFGWEGAFYLGALLPAIMFPLLLFLLPESIRFRVSRNPADPRIGPMLKQMDSKLVLKDGGHFALDDTPRKKATLPVTGLFQDGLLKMTLLVWSAFIMAFLFNQMTNNWSTTILHHVVGIDLQRIALIVSLETAAAMLGTITVGFIMDRFGSTRVLSLLFAASAALLVLLGLIDLKAWYALGIFALQGYIGGSALAGLNAQAAMTYPPRMRVTGIAWGTGIGRLGGMMGPMVGGALLAGAQSVTVIYIVAAIPQLLAGIAVFFMAWAARGAGRAAAVRT